MYNCLYCKKEMEYRRGCSNIYCNNRCQKMYESDQKIREWIDKGISWKMQIPQWAKRYLAETRGYKCEICDISEWNNQKIQLECDHIDGIHYNNSPDNLRLICPNCHSQTTTYKNRNHGNGRTINKLS